jgi:hypothetical protein
MATLYDEAGAVVASGFMVLRESRLTQRRTDIVHDLLTGGLPFVVRRDPGGLSGSLEFLCPSSEMADTIYAAHAAGPLRLDNWQRQNVLTDPRATSSPPWTAYFGAGGSGTETMVSDASDGPVLPGGYQITTYARYTITTPGTGNVTFGSSASGTSWPPIEAGVSYAMGIYVRSSAAASSVAVRKDGYLAGSASGAAQFGDAVALPAAEWVPLESLEAAELPFDTASIRANFQGSEMSAAQTIDVTCALLVPDATTVPDYFDGGMPDTALLVNEWAAVENFSVSQQYERPVLDFTYLPVGGVGIPVKSSRNYWRVSVPSIQEVSVA